MYSNSPTLFPVLRILLTGFVSTALFGSMLSPIHAATLPTLPQTYIDTTYAAPAGTTTVVNAGGNLQTAINNAAPGDTIVVAAGASFNGPINLPNKSGNAWIYIQSSAYASLPVPGSRVSIADAANMPKIIAPAAGGAAITTSAQAHHYRFVGIEIRPPAGQYVTALVSIGNAETSLASLPHDITFDRCYVHGDPTAGGRRGIAMNGASGAVIDSYLSDFKEVGADTQAVWTYNSPGPLKIVNNYLEAAGENFMSGGADPKIANLIPSDIEIRRNYFFKPLSWNTNPITWSVKNLLEFKNAQRILVEGNRFENIWASGQIGALINAKSSNQDGTCTWCVTQDLTVRYNVGVNLENGFQLSGAESNGGAGTMPAVMTRVLVEHNVVAITTPNNGSGRIFQIVGGPSNLTIRHNTGLILIGGNQGGTSLFAENNPKSDQFDFRDNLLSNGAYGFAGTGAGSGTSVLTAYFTNYTFFNNAFIGGNGTYPTTTRFPANNTAVGFVNFSGGDYTLTSTSAYHNASSDGTDVGANIAAVRAAANINPPPPIPQNLRVK